MSRYDIFLSYSSSDKVQVEKLARKLHAAGWKVFFDDWSLIPGTPIQESQEEALTKSRTCAVFFGSSGLEPWQNEELRVAIAEYAQKNQMERIMPVLLPGSSGSQITGFLARFNRVDMRSDVEEGYSRIVAGIRGQPPGRRSSQQRVSDHPLFFITNTTLTMSLVLILHVWAFTVTDTLSETLSAIASSLALMATITLVLSRERFRKLRVRLINRTIYSPWTSATLFVVLIPIINWTFLGSRALLLRPNHIIQTDAILYADKKEWLRLEVWHGKKLLGEVGDYKGEALLIGSNRIPPRDLRRLHKRWRRELEDVDDQGILLETLEAYSITGIDSTLQPGDILQLQIKYADGKPYMDTSFRVAYSTLEFPQEEIIREPI